MRTARRGFTLIELMTTVAIIGLLAAIAIPSFVSYQLRSRQTERAVVSRSIHEAVTLLWIRDGKFPNDFGFLSFVWCPPNPPGIPLVSKRQFVPGAGDWGRLSMPIEGALYYTYDVFGEAGAGGRWHFISSEGDLDGDGNRATQTHQYLYVSEGLVADNEVNAGGVF
jgi:prepilin-type N-terminal cleavage/methylation domain-containing protein